MLFLSDGLDILPASGSTDSAHHVNDFSLGFGENASAQTGCSALLQAWASPIIHACCRAACCLWSPGDFHIVSFSLRFIRY